MNAIVVAEADSEGGSVEAIKHSETSKRGC